jgi:type I site-specific restriction endonuclease
MAKRHKDPKASEVDAYVYIKENLKIMGWDVRNPLRFPGTGQVFTQAEALYHPELKKYLRLDKPENIVKISEQKYWVIEAKRDRKEIKKALKEAIDYAKAINQSSNIKALFVSGIAGNDADTYLIENRYWDGQQFQRIRINGKDVTGLLSPELIKDVLDAGPDLPPNIAPALE